MRARIILLCLLPLLFLAPLSAQKADAGSAATGAAAQPGYPAPGGAPARKVLSQADIDRFIRDWPRILAELEALGADFEEEMGDDPSAALGLAAALKADGKVKAVLGKYGWKEGFWDTWAAILAGVGLAEVEKGFKEAGMAMPPEYAAILDASVHPEDRVLIRKNLERLEKLLEETDE